jgi:hypothetical protein
MFLDTLMEMETKRLNVAINRRRKDYNSTISDKARGRRDWPWLTAIGAVLMFCSWICQNQFAAQFSEERQRLERTQLSIDLAQLRMEQWQVVYMQEKAKSNPDSKILLAASFKALQAHLNAVAWSSAGGREDEAQAAQDIYSKNVVQGKLAERYKHGELEALEKDLNESAAIENQLDVVGNLTEDFVKKFARTRQLENWCTTLFIIMFALGSFVAALDFVRRRRRVTSGSP